MYSNSLLFTHHTLKTESLMDSSSPVDFYYSTTKPAGGGDNNFIIDDLLDFSNEEDDTLLNDNDNDNDHDNNNNNNNNTFQHSINGNSTDSTVTADSSLSGHFDVSHHSFPDVPYDDMAELEWLSNFVEESFSSEEDIHKLNLISGVKTDVISEQQKQTRNVVNNDDDDNSPNQHHPIFRSEITVPGKARSKRPRIAPCNWSSRLLAVTPSPATSEASETDYIPFNCGKKPVKIHRKKDNLVSDGRRCLHCATDKTPQWRTGPLGPKTLCNACGVRFKSGRLVPEYRPANSPTFMLAKHSNSHRKVMEMRRQKEMQRSQREQFLYAPIFDVSGCADDYLIHHDTGSEFSQLI